MGLALASRTEHDVCGIESIFTRPLKDSKKVDPLISLLVEQVDLAPRFHNAYPLGRKLS